MATNPKTKIIQDVKKGLTIPQASEKYKIPELEITQWCIIEDIKNKKSLRSTSKKYNIPLSTVAHWCNNAKIRSTHSRAPEKADDARIIEKVHENKTMTVAQLEKELGYQTNAIRRRLRRLVKKKKLQYIVIPGGGGQKVLRIFKGYVDKQLYYGTEKDLNTWIAEKLPKDLPPTLRRMLTQKMNDMGIPFTLKKIDKKALFVEKDTAKRIKTAAERKGMSINDYLESKL